MNEDSRLVGAMTNPPKTKRGRPPLGDRPLTLAERQKRARARMRELGVKHFLLSLHGEKLRLVEEIAQGMQVSRVQALTYIVNVGLGDVWFAVEEMRDRLRDGDSPEVASSKLRQVFGVDSSEGGGVAED